MSFKRKVQQWADSIPPLHLPGYNYAGPNTKNYSKKPKNRLDSLCRMHDLAMRSLGKKYSYTSWNSADDVFLFYVENLEPSDSDEALSKDIILRYFRNKKKILPDRSDDMEVAQIVGMMDNGFYNWTRDSPRSIYAYAPEEYSTPEYEGKYELVPESFEKSEAMDYVPIEYDGTKRYKMDAGMNLKVSPNASFVSTTSKFFTKKKRRRKPFNKRQLAYLKAAILGSFPWQQCRYVSPGKVAYTQGRAGISSLSGMTSVKFDTVASDLTVTNVLTDIHIKNYAMKLMIHNPSNYSCNYEVYLFWPKTRTDHNPTNVVAQLDTDYSAAALNYDPNRINQMIWDNPELNSYYAIKHYAKGTLAPQDHKVCLYRRKMMKINLNDWDADAEFGLSSCTYHPLFTHFFVIKVWGDFGFDTDDVGTDYVSTFSGEIGVVHEESWQQRVATPYDQTTWSTTVKSDYPTSITLRGNDFGTVETPSIP